MVVPVGVVVTTSDHDGRGRSEPAARSTRRGGAQAPTETSSRRFERPSVLRQIAQAQAELADKAGNPDRRG